ncbi:acyl-CoA synthetase (NDP forming) [Desulfosporosinus orientis DSM 765]|uniref:Acyl-CoA synthetase (NDP forming) n=1 Tax=Desulfosporosinus orientis (strain ATCC 19365 / DSM 765 / NCIMB 8382 / VKM B-1628 / Singapore I) TaxID=768706 RepID=G7WB06_DESOD|nr:acetate--CoA ligase family protein [Desulfosporosinus orientis]AET67507.1 acyl-CoA synthetase (NDP forming) [Desulfosporosinus orientis DSM 765]
MNLTKLLKPRSVAVVGASEKVGFGGDSCRNILDNVEDVSRIYFINPKRDEVLGHKCYPSIDAIPDTLDLLIICTPQNTVIPLLEEGAAKGVGGAVVYASGYGETGTGEGRNNEKELMEAAERLNIAVMGPNCAGFINFTDDIYSFAFLSEKRDRKGSVGIISQSGQLCLSMMDDPGMRFSYTISAGNAKCVRMEDYMEFLIEDENTKVVGLYIEGVKAPGQFVRALKRASELKKPVVILKAGRSEKGGAIAASHTGSLSGSDKAFDAVLNKFGAIRVDDLEELIAMTMLLSTLNCLPAKPTVAAMCLSGGETGICADVGSLYNIKYPDFAPETLEELRRQLPSYATPNNPLDMTASLSYDAELYANALRTVISDQNVGMVIIGYTLLNEIADPAIHYMYKGIEKVLSENLGKPIAMLPFAENTRNREYQEKLFKIGVPILPPPVYAFKLLGYLSKYVEYQTKERTLELMLPERTPEKFTALSEYSSKMLLKDFGVPVADSIIAKTTDEAVEYWKRVGGKLVMKIESADVLHKSDVGGVALNIEGEEGIRRAFDTVMTNVRSKRPDANINGILTAPMLKQGVEMIVGVSNDPQFGPMIMVGMGGVFVEVFKDVALYPAPLCKAEALEMLMSLKSFPLLKGARGNKVCDLDALCETIVAIGNFAVSHKDTLKELDINPLFVYAEGEGVGVADALIVLEQ